MRFGMMDNQVFCLQSKLKRLLYKFLEGKCPKRVDQHLEKFLTLLWEQEESEVESTLRALPIFSEWIKEAVVTWTTTRTVPPTTVALFTLKLASLLSKNERRFSSLNTGNFFIKLINCLKVRRTVAAPSVKLGYIKLLSSLLDHQTGVEWMIASCFWEDVYKLSVSKQSDEIAKEATRFVSKILEKTIVSEENFCDDVVKKIMLPLGENVYKSIKACDIDGGRDEGLKLTLQLIGDVLEYFLEKIYLEDKDFSVVFLFLENFHLEERISDLMVMAQTKSLVSGLAKITFIMQFLELYVKILTRSISVANINASVDRIRNSFTSHISKGNLQNIEICKFGILYWNLIDMKISTFRKKTPDGDFSIPLYWLIGGPIYFTVIKYFLSEKELDEINDADDVRNIYMNKAWKLVTQDMIRVYYNWRDPMLARQDLLTLSVRSFIDLKQTLKYLKKDQAVIMFKEYVYTIKDIITSIQESSEKLEMMLKESDFFLNAFDFFAHLIEEFNITWKDSVEAIGLIDLLFEFLSVHDWPTEVVVQVLKLLNIAVVKYMSPNLALLVDNSTDSIMDVLGVLVSAKLLSEARQVKKSALEMVCTMSSLSTSKFPSLQKVLMDSELPTLVVKMSTCDGESFVRATAIKCLQEMIQVEEIWNNALRTEDLPQKMRDILLNETEGIVRVEAATFMCVAYEHQQFQKEHLDQVYETMIYSSTTDLHWEVKVRALNFWDKVIKNHLQNQGMIDDSFPNVTFSKEHRKIVTLTDSEIRKRLLKVLAQLSTIGCLGVLMSAIKDDCDMEVSKTAVKITQRLVDLFKKYNVRGDCSTPTSPAPTENGTISVSSGVSVDESMDSPRSSHPDLNEEILDQIVNSKDVSLLKNVYSPSDYGSVSNYDIQVRKVVTPNEFLQFTQQDLNSLINEKKNWLNGIEDLGSLLDDMLKTYEDDVNNMDCY